MKTLIRTLLAPALLALVSCAESTPPLNVVLIVIDDLGWIDTGVYGSSFYETPHIDQLAAEHDLSISQALAVLLGLELKGVIRQLPGKRFVRE